MKKINLAVVAHVDHGKSTLCDAIIELCEKIIINQKTPTLDSHTIEKQRGVTIRNHFVSLNYLDCIINLLDTPGHYDFAQYVSVGINSADIVCIVVDAVKGIQPQTLAYVNLCTQKGVNVVIAINKIDIWFSEVENVKNVIKAHFGANQHVIELSAFKRINIENLLTYVYNNAKPNNNYVCKKHKGLYVLDCAYSNGLTSVLIHVSNIKISVNTTILIKNKRYRINKICEKKFNSYKNLNSVENNICYVWLNIQSSVLNNLIGCVLYENNIVKVCEEKMHTCYTGIVTSSENNLKLKTVINKICSSDPGIQFYTKFSKLYGSVFVCGFFGDFHREIFLEILHIESNVGFSTCYVGPNYKCKLSGNNFILDYENKMLNVNFRKLLANVLTPFVKFSISFKQEYYSKVYNMLSRNSYNTITNTEFVINTYIITVNMPFTVLLLGFVNKLKSLTNGYAQYVIQKIEYVEKQLCLIEFFLNNELIQELSVIEIKELAESVALFYIQQLETKLQRQQFLIKLSVKIDKKNYKSVVVKPYRKDVTAKLYGGDSTRRKKLLNKQKEGKNLMFKNANISAVKKSIISVITDSYK